LKRAKSVTTAVVLALIVIGIIALVEKGRPQPYVYKGASPASTGKLGTYLFLSEVKKRYPATTAVFYLDQLSIPSGAKHCVYIAISPEEEYGVEEARTILGRLKECSYPALFIADETPISNTLLAVANSSIRIEDTILVDPRTGAPYPTAYFYLDSFNGSLLLDIASMLRGSGEVLGYVPLAGVVAVQGSTTTPRILHNIPIAMYESLGDLSVVVVSDGSIFLNQVLSSGRGSDYLRLGLSIIDKLCERDPSCIVLFDGMKYERTPLGKALESTEFLELYDPLMLLMLYIASILHPSTWLPVAADALNNAVELALANRVSASILALLAIAMSYRFIRERLPRIPDARLREQEEVEVFVTGNIRKAIMTGKYKLDRNDFLKLYEIVDVVFRNTVGYGLDDSRLVRVLASYIGYERATRYFVEMNRLKEKVLGHKILPLVLSWNRTVTRLLRESEEVLNRIGASLEAEKGAEYIVLRGY